MFNEEEAVPLAPIGFIQLQSECHYLPPNTFPTLTKRNLKKYLLPDTSTLCGEEHFAELSIGWNVDGIELLAGVNASITRVSYPEVSRGDSVELFFDTRNVKTSGFNTRFCHHFFFLPEAVEGQM